LFLFNKEITLSLKTFLTLFKTFLSWCILSMWCKWLLGFLSLLSQNFLKWACILFFLLFCVLKIIKFFKCIS